MFSLAKFKVFNGMPKILPNPLTVEDNLCLLWFWISRVLSLVQNARAIWSTTWNKHVLFLANQVLLFVVLGTPMT